MLGNEIEAYRENVFLDFSVYQLNSLLQPESSLTMRIVGLLGLIPSFLILPATGASLFHTYVREKLLNEDLAGVAEKTKKASSQTSVSQSNTVKPSTLKEQPQTSIKDSIAKTTAMVKKADSFSAVKAVKYRNSTYNLCSTEGKSKSLGLQVGEKVYQFKKIAGEGEYKIARVIKPTSANETSLIYVKLKRDQRTIKNIKCLAKEIKFLTALTGIKEFPRLLFTYTDPKTGQLIGLGLEKCDRDLFDYHEENRSFRTIQWDFFEFLASAAVHLADRGIIHHDIKFENILIKNENEKVIFKLIDFGLTCYMNQENLTSHGAGSPLYAAPETWKTGVNRDKSDLWSIGIIMYFAAFNHYPDVYYTNANRTHLDLQKISESYKTLSNEKIQSFYTKDSKLRTVKVGSMGALIKDLLTVDPQERMTAKEFQSRLRALNPNNHTSTFS